MTLLLRTIIYDLSHCYLLAYYNVVLLFTYMKIQLLEEYLSSFSLPKVMILLL